MKKKAASEDKNKNIIFSVYDWVETAAFSIVAVTLMFTFMFRIVNVDGSSMRNTLMDNDKLIVSNLFYTPSAGDIVIISRSDVYDAEPVYEPLIKRVIATGGQTVDIDFESGTVYVDGKALEDKYVKEPTYRKGDIEFPITVDENCVFVMGDNRNDSKDSRFSEIGVIPNDRIIGKALVRFYPLDDMKTLW